MGKQKDNKPTKKQQHEFWKHNIHPILGYRIDHFSIKSQVIELQGPIELKITG